MGIYAPLTVQRRNNTANVGETSVVQTGWVNATPGVVNAISITVTFPVAYTAAPIVVATFGGDSTGATSTLGSGTVAVNNAFAEAVSITTTNFVLRIATPGANWAAGNTVYAQWIAIGL